MVSAGCFSSLFSRAICSNFPLFFTPIKHPVGADRNVPIPSAWCASAPSRWEEKNVRRAASVSGATGMLMTIHSGFSRVSIFLFWLYNQRRFQNNSQKLPSKANVLLITPEGMPKTEGWFSCLSSEQCDKNLLNLKSIPASFSPPCSQWLFQRHKSISFVTECVSEHGAVQSNTMRQLQMHAWAAHMSRALKEHYSIRKREKSGFDYW